MRIVRIAFLGFLICLFQSQPFAATLVYSGLLGSGGEDWNDESIYDMTADPTGNVFVTGATGSTNFPATASYGQARGVPICFVTKINPQGSQLIYSTHLATGRGRAIAIDSQGNAYIAGETHYTFPITNAVQNTRGSDNEADLFIAKLDPNGQLIFATYFGGSGPELALDLALDGAGDILVTGMTMSTNFPVTAQAAQKTLAGNDDAFILKLSANGSKVLLASYVGGPGRENAGQMMVGKDGAIYLSGKSTSTRFANAQAFGSMTNHGRADAFLCRLNPATGAVEHLAYFGGQANDAATGLAIDGMTGAIYLAGTTLSPDLPSTPGAFQREPAGEKDFFVAKFDPAVRNLEWATYLGGSSDEDATSIQYLNEAIGYYPFERGGLALDPAGNIYVGGTSSSQTFSGAQNTTLWGQGNDGFMARLNPAGSKLLDLVFLGGSYYDALQALCVLSESSIFVSGATSFAGDSPLFPTTTSSFNRTYRQNVTDTFVSRISLVSGPPANDDFANANEIHPFGVTEAASNVAATAQPAEANHAGQPPVHSLWWKFKPAQSGSVIVTTEGSDFDTILAAYSGSPLKAVDQNDNWKENEISSRLKIVVQPGETYYVVADGKDGASGNLLVTFDFSDVANDHIASRQIITNYPVSILATNTFATRELREPYHGSLGRHSLWWEWISPVTTAVAISTVGSKFDTTMAIYKGTEFSNLQVLVWENDSIGRDSVLPLFVNMGERYLIAVDGVYGQTGELRLSINKGQPPANDNFANAMVLPDWKTELSVTNLTASLETGEENLFSHLDARGSTLWWTWTAPTNGWVKIETFGGNENTDPKLVIFKGTNLPSLKLVAENDNGFGESTNYNSRIYSPVQQGESWHIRVDTSIYRSGGIFGLKLTMNQPPVIEPGSVQFTASGELQFQVSAIAGRNYILQSSTNLKDWTDLGPRFNGTTFTVKVAKIGNGAFVRLLEFPME